MPCATVILHLTWQYLPKATTPPARCARRKLVVLSNTSRFCSTFDPMRFVQTHQDFRFSRIDLFSRTSVSAAPVYHGQCTTSFHPMCSASKEKRVILVVFLGSVSSLPLLDCDHFYLGSSGNFCSMTAVPASGAPRLVTCSVNS